MLIGHPAVYAVCYLHAALIVPFLAGTEVAVQDSSFSLFTASLRLDGFVVQDPNVPEESLLEIPRPTLDAGMLPLLSK